MSTDDKKPRAGFAAVIGAPNAGKSTLVNQMVGNKVSIVSPKIQTTRTLVRGIVTHGPAQIVFIDTPGLFQPKQRLQRAMVAAAWSGREDADLTLLLVDAAAKKIGDDTEAILRRLKEMGGTKPAALVLNKIDGLKADTLLPLSQKLNEMAYFDATFMVSALRGDGVKDLLDWLALRMPEGPWLYPEDQINDMPGRQLAAEITREKLFRRLHDELPHSLTVETDGWEVRADGSVMAHQTIIVARESHKPIVLGKGGSMIKWVGEESRKEMEEITGTRIHLKLFVRVEEKWTEDADHYRVWGLDFNA